MELGVGAVVGIQVDRADHGLGHVHDVLHLVDAEDTWRDFKQIMEIAIGIGRLQYHLDRINSDSPVSIIDSIYQQTHSEETSAPTPSSIISLLFVCIVLAPYPNTVSANSQAWLAFLP